MYWPTFERVCILISWFNLEISTITKTQKAMPKHFIDHIFSCIYFNNLRRKIKIIFITVIGFSSNFRSKKSTRYVKKNRLFRKLYFKIYNISIYRVIHMLCLFSLASSAESCFQSPMNVLLQRSGNLQYVEVWQ